MLADGHRSYHAGMLYPRNESPHLDPALFAKPTAEYRGAPFWSWNCTLDRARLFRQIEALKAMGMGGFHMHSRVGLATEYLGEEFMGNVKACVEKARSDGMLAWLYDEDRWPSGFAGSLVTRDERFQAKQLLFTVSADPQRGTAPFVAGAPTLLARYAVTIDPVDLCLARYRRLAEGESAATGEVEWRAFLRNTWTNPWFNDFTYVDTLNQAATEKFLEVTHEKYFAAVGKDFGGLVPAIFTDEPAFEAFRALPSPLSRDDVIMSWTTDFSETYQKAWHEDLLDFLPELVWQLPAGKASRARYRYHDHNAERFASAYADTIGAWCDKHGILFTGHMMEEHTLSSQTRMIGEAMRSYRGFSLPGIDMLCDSIELTTAKQAQSAARQYGRAGVMSELYGVTGWDFDFTGHKRQGDWQAALGISVRVPHLSWVSMGSEAKRDYPAPLDEHSPWYREYPLVEDHFARLNTVLTRGKAVVRVAMIHPIESHWLNWGPGDQCRIERDARDHAHHETAKWLLHDLIDFDFVAESLLPSQCQRIVGKAFRVGMMSYDVVIVPDLRTIRATTLERLEAFVAKGGTVLFAGAVPELVDAEPSQRAVRLAAKCAVIPLTRTALTQALAPFREVTAICGWGGEGLLHQLRQDGDTRWLFICNSNRDAGCTFKLILRGAWDVGSWDTTSSAQRALPAAIAAGATELSVELPGAGHILLRLIPAVATTRPASAVRPALAMKESLRLGDPVKVTLSEPNVLLIDQVEYRLDDGAWQPREEILRIGQICREKIGLPPQGGGMAQPWVHPPEPPTHRITLRFTVESSVDISDARLALEGLHAATIQLDGVPLPVTPQGWWVDEAIALQPLPPLSAGEHDVEISVPFGRATPFEWLYLLGTFGVEVMGSHTRLCDFPTHLAWGDWTRQGLPFYAGNVTYHARFTTSGGALTLRTPQFKAPLLQVAIDGGAGVAIAFPPYQLALGELSAGEHTCDLTAFGSRVNAFSCLHHTNAGLRWVGPDAWRSRDDDWSYEYQLRPCGILTAPRLLAALAPATPLVAAAVGH